MTQRSSLENIDVMPTFPVNFPVSIRQTVNQFLVDQRAQKPSILTIARECFALALIADIAEIVDFTPDNILQCMTAQLQFKKFKSLLKDAQTQFFLNELLCKLLVAPKTIATKHTCNLKGYQLASFQEVKSGDFVRIGKADDLHNYDWQYINPQQGINVERRLHLEKDYVDFVALDEKTVGGIHFGTNSPVLDIYTIAEEKACFDRSIPLVRNSNNLTPTFQYLPVTNCVIIQSLYYVPHGKQLVPVIQFVDLKRNASWGILMLQHAVVEFNYLTAIENKDVFELAIVFNDHQWNIHKIDLAKQIDMVVSTHDLKEMPIEKMKRPPILSSLHGSNRLLLTELNLVVDKRNVRQLASETNGIYHLGNKQGANYSTYYSAPSVSFNEFSDGKFCSWHLRRGFELYDWQRYLSFPSPLLTIIKDYVGVTESFAETEFMPWWALSDSLKEASFELAKSCLQHSTKMGYHKLCQLMRYLNAAELKDKPVEMVGACIKRVQEEFKDEKIGNNENKLFALLLDEAKKMPPRGLLSQRLMTTLARVGAPVCDRLDAGDVKLGRG